MPEEVAIYNAKVFFVSEGCHIRAFSGPSYPKGFHMCDYYELIIVFKGGCRLGYEDSYFDISKGDAFVITPLVKNVCFDMNKFYARHLLISKELFDRMYGEASGVNGFDTLMGFDGKYNGINFGNRILHLDDEQLQFIASAFTSVFSIDSSRLVTPPIKIHTLYMLLYYLSDALLSQLYGKDSKNCKYAHLISIATEYINENLDGKITLEALSNKVHLSRSSFVRAFEQVYDMPPMLYVAKLRARRAKDLLTQGNTAKTVIAQMCGYYDISHMSRMIEKYL